MIKIHPSHICSQCGGIEPMPFKCSHCGGNFCGEHRLPENHNCSINKIWHVKPKEQKFDSLGRQLPSCKIMVGNGYFSYIFV